MVHRIHSISSQAYKQTTKFDLGWFARRGVKCNVYSKLPIEEYFTYDLG